MYVKGIISLRISNRSVRNRLILHSITEQRMWEECSKDNKWNEYIKYLMSPVSSKQNDNFYPSSWQTFLLKENPVVELYEMTSFNILTLCISGKVYLLTY